MLPGCTIRMWHRRIYQFMAIANAQTNRLLGVLDTAYDGLIYRQAQADSLATALRCWSSRLCA